MKKRVTMATIAQEAGVSKTTVSLALKNHPSLPQKTCQRIQAIAESFGYRPDPTISAIASGHWRERTPERFNTLALIVTSQNKYQGATKTIIELVKARASESGYKVEVVDLCDYPSAKACSRVLHARGIRGVLLAPPSPGEALSVELEWEKFTSVCLEKGFFRVPIHFVTHDMFNITRDAWQKVYDAGYNKIGAALYLHNPVAEDDWSRIGSSYAARDLLPIEEKDYIPFLKCDHQDREATLAWYHKHKPDVIIALTTKTYEHLTEAGIRVPEDVAYICLIGDEDKPHISCCVDLRPQIVNTAMQMLINEIKENAWGIPKIQKCTLLEPVWNEGQTLPVRV